MPIHNWGRDVYAKDDKHGSRNIQRSSELKCPPVLSAKDKTLAADPSMLCHTPCMKIYVPHRLRHQIKCWAVIHLCQPDDSDA